MLSLITKSLIFCLILKYINCLYSKSTRDSSNFYSSPNGDFSENDFSAAELSKSLFGQEASVDNTLKTIGELSNLKEDSNNSTKRIRHSTKPDSYPSELSQSLSSSILLDNSLEESKENSLREEVSPASEVSDSSFKNDKSVSEKSFSKSPRSKRSRRNSIADTSISSSLKSSSRSPSRSKIKRKISSPMSILDTSLSSDNSIITNAKSIMEASPENSLSKSPKSVSKSISKSVQKSIPVKITENSLSDFSKSSMFSENSVSDISKSVESETSSVESTPLLNEEISIKSISDKSISDKSISDKSISIPSRKSNSQIENSYVQPYSPVDEGSEYSNLLDGSLASETSADISILPSNTGLETSVASNSITLLSSLYGSQALSGAPPDFSDELLKIEVKISEVLFNSGLNISNAEITLLTQRIIFEGPNANYQVFGNSLDSNSFETIPSYNTAKFNFLECVYQIENILFHTRSFISSISMSHILLACNNLRRNLNIGNSISEKDHLLVKAIKYLILRIYNINNQEIVQIVNNKSSLPSMLDSNSFKKLESSLADDFKSEAFSFPLAFDLWKTILIEQLYAFNFNSKGIVNNFIEDSFGLINILLDAIYADPIKMCFYVTAVIFYKISPFSPEEIKINSVKIQTFCLIYLKNMGFNELNTLEKLKMPNIVINNSISSLTKQLVAGFNVLPYFHPEFPKENEVLNWENCYSIFSSVSMMLNTLNDQSIFPQIFPLCEKITGKHFETQFVLKLFVRILDIPVNLINDLTSIQNINDLFSALANKLEVPENFIKDIYQNYIQGNPIKYLNLVSSVFSKSLKYFISMENSKNSYNQNRNNQVKELDDIQIFKRMEKWSSIHLYFLSFTMSVPNSNEILGGIYSFTPSNCESLLFTFFRRVNYSTRSSIVDSVVICITIYTIIYKDNISPILIKNKSIEDLKTVLNYKIGTWAPTQGEWMRSIYMVLRSKLGIIPSISTIQTLSIAINEDFFNCFHSVNKYIHGSFILARSKNNLTSNQNYNIIRDRLLGFNICSSLTIGAHSTKEESIELRIMSTILESIREFGFKSNVGAIKQFIQLNKQGNESKFPSGDSILKYLISNFPEKLQKLIFKSYIANSSPSNILPYFIQAEEIISKFLEMHNCKIEKNILRNNESNNNFSVTFNNNSYYNIINSCLSWKTFGYFNIISCYSTIVNLNICESKEIALEVVIDVAKSLEWPIELIFINLSQDNSLSDIKLFLDIKEKVDNNELEKYKVMESDLIIAKENNEEFSWSEKSLSRSENTLFSMESSEKSNDLNAKVDYSFALGISPNSLTKYLELWNYRKEIVLRQMQHFPVKNINNVDFEYIKNHLIIAPTENKEKILHQIILPYINIFKQICYEKPYGSYLCEIDENIGLPKVKVIGRDFETMSGSISIMSPPAEFSSESSVIIKIASVEDSLEWKELEPQKLIYLNVLFGQNWDKEFNNYLALSKVYFPYSGEYIRLTPHLFSIERKMNSDSSLIDNSEFSASKSFNSNDLPGIWHENLGNITINKLCEFVKYIPDNSELIINIVWTIISSIKSFWAGNVEHCRLSTNSIFVYTGIRNQLNSDLERVFNNFIEFGPNEENIHFVTNFILKTLSPSLIRFGELGNSKLNFLFEQENSINVDCDDKRDILNIIREIVSLSSELKDKLIFDELEDICKEISNIDNSKLNCNSLAWVDKTKSYPKDLDKWPITDVIMVTPAINKEISENTKTFDDLSLGELSKFSEEKSEIDMSAFPKSVESIPSSIISKEGSKAELSEFPASIPSVHSSTNSKKNSKTELSAFPESTPSVSAKSEISVPISNDREVSVPKKSELSNSLDRSSKSQSLGFNNELSNENLSVSKPEASNISNSFKKSILENSQSNIFEQDQVTNEESMLNINPKEEQIPKKPYTTEDLNEFITVKIPKRLLLNIEPLPKITSNLSERRKFELKEIMAQLKGIVDDIVNKFTSWSSLKTGKHSVKVPDLLHKPGFIFVPPTPNNRADALRILEKYYNINESVFLLAKEEFQRLKLIEQQKNPNDLVDVVVSKANLYYINKQLGANNQIEKQNSQTNIDQTLKSDNSFELSSSKKRMSESIKPQIEVSEHSSEPSYTDKSSYSNRDLSSKASNSLIFESDLSSSIEKSNDSIEES